MITAKHRQIGPGHVRTGKKAAMRWIQALVAILLTVLVAACVGLYGDRLFSTRHLPQNPGASPAEVDPILKARAIPVEAMTGTWERLGAAGLPMRLLLELSEDHATLIGTKRQAGKSSQFLMRKAEGPDSAGKIASAVNLGS